MDNRIEAVAAGAPQRLLPVEHVYSQRRPAHDDQPAQEPDPGPGASFAKLSDDSANAYPRPAEPPHAGLHASEDVAPALPPALAEALAAEPWGYPMPAKSVWEAAVAARERAAADARLGIAAPKQAAAASGGSAAPPIEPAWLAPLLRPR